MNRPCQTGDRKKTRAKPWRATASREVTTFSTMADENQHKDEQNNLLPPDPADVDDMMLDIDGDGFIFSDDAFPSLPDFPCLSSPCASPSPSSASTMLPSKNAPPLSSCSSASSPSSSSSWSFLQVPDGGGSELPSEPAPPAEDFMMLSQPPSGDFSDILGDIDLFDLSVDPWDPSSLLHADDGSASEAVPEEVVEVEGQGSGGAPLPAREDEGSSEELARIFLDWLRNNKDAISPEDLRSIKLKRATIESAARRLGRTKQGRTQLLRLILTWVQNNHLQRRRQQRPPCHAAPPNPTPLDYAFPAAADSNLAPRCNTWMPYSMDPSAGSPNPALLAAYGGGGNGDMAYPYTSNLMVNSQPFSPSTDFIDPAASGGPWSGPLASPIPPQFAHPLSLVAPTQYSGGFANHLLGPMCHQGQRLFGVAASATKEARKKRMARQRRVSSLHHHRGNSHHQQQNLPHAHHGVGTAEVANGTPNPNPRSWGFWANMSPSSHHLGDTRISSNMQQTTSTPPSAAAQLQHRPQQPTAATSAEKRQGWKGEKNLKFLLQKVLKQSDVGSLGRIVLPKKEAETHLPELDARDGISIPMEDIGTSQVWNMRYRFWPNNKSRMYLLENTGDFVRSNGLQEGDFIVIYSDVKCSKYMIRGVKVRQAAAEPRLASGRNAVKARPRRNGSEKMRGSGMQEGADEDEDIIAPP